MAAWGNRYSALLQESSSHKSSPVLSSAFAEPARPSLSAENESNMPIKVKYPPNSSVFVASLPAGASDSIRNKLTNLVSEYIQQFNVKIIDDKLGHKAAFVQTKSSEDAQHLLEKTLVLDGKLLRLELARAHRTLHISFKSFNATTTIKLRIIRDAEGHLRAVINEAAAPATWSPRRPDDQFSGTGHLITNFQLDEENLHKLCALIGPLEWFHKHTATAEVQDPAQSRTDSGHEPSNGVKATDDDVWEVKWGAREDAMEAKSLFATIPFIRWSWAHTRGTDINRQRSGDRTRLGSEHFIHHQRYNRTSNQKEQAGSINTGWAAKQDTKVVTPESVPHIPVNNAPYSTNSGFASSITSHQTHPDFVKKVPQHQRASSDDPEAPITPVSIRHTSPQIAPAGENEASKLYDLSLPVLDNQVEGPPQNLSYLEPLSSRDANIQYDMTTLFVAGVPKWSKDKDLKSLFEPFGEISDVSFTTTKGDYHSAFISFTNTKDPAAAVRAALEGRHFMLDNSSLKVHYKRINSAPRNRRNGERSINQSNSQFIRLGFRHKNNDSKEKNVEGTTNVDPEQLEVSDIKPSDTNRSPEIRLKDDNSRKESRRDSTPSDTTTSQITYSSSEGFRSTDHPSSSLQNATHWPEMAQSTVSSPYYSYYPVTHPWHPAYQWPSPAYPPMYAVSPYGHTFWYPHSGFPSQMPYTQVNSQPKLATTDNSQAMSNPPAFHPGKAPVIPAGSYQNPDGSTNYIYPTEVIEKYMTKPPERASTGTGADEHNSRPLGQTNHVAPENQHYVYPPYQYPSIPQGQQYPATHPPFGVATQEMKTPPVAVPYHPYPVLPPPSAEMQQGTFVFNQQGAAQKIEPAGYHPASIDRNTQASRGIGFAQVAAAMMVNGEQQSAPLGSTIPHTPHYANNATAPGYYYPTNTFPSAAQYNHGIGFGSTENPHYTMGGNRNNSRRRGSYNTHNRTHFVNPSIQAGVREDVNGRFGTMGGPQLPQEGVTSQ